MARFTNAARVVGMCRDQRHKSECEGGEKGAQRLISVFSLLYYGTYYAQIQG